MSRGHIRNAPTQFKKGQTRFSLFPELRIKGRTRMSLLASLRRKGQTQKSLFASRRKTGQTQLSLLKLRGKKGQTQLSLYDLHGKTGQSRKSLFAELGKKGQLRLSLYDLLGIDPNCQLSKGHQRRHVPTSPLLTRPTRNPIPFTNRESPPKRRRGHRPNGTTPEASGEQRHLNEPTDSPHDPCSSASIRGWIFLPTLIKLCGSAALRETSSPAAHEEDPRAKS